MAVFDMYVHLPHNFKGTHMSRFVEILNQHEREISVESFESMLHEMIERLDAGTGQNALTQAKQADQQIAKGEITPLTGIPLSIKDLICTKGIKTTCASKILESNKMVPVAAKVTVVFSTYRVGKIAITGTTISETMASGKE